MRRVLVLLLGLMAVRAEAEGERAGDFDYYVLALSWSPSWCAREGDAEDAPECDRGSGRGLVLHGLWPQYEAGWPSYCRTGMRDPTRAETAAMADVMGSGGLARYQWQKHGRCAGLDPRAYFAAARRSFAAVRVPPLLAAPTTPRQVAPREIEAAVLAANPSLSAAGVTVTCQGGAVAELRVCLTRDLAPRACAADVSRDCSQPRIAVPPIR